MNTKYQYVVPAIETLHLTIKPADQIFKTHSCYQRQPWKKSTIHFFGDIMVFSIFTRKNPLA